MQKQCDNCRVTDPVVKQTEEMENYYVWYVYCNDSDTPASCVEKPLESIDCELARRKAGTSPDLTLDALLQEYTDRYNEHCVAICTEREPCRFLKDE